MDLRTFYNLHYCSRWSRRWRNTNNFAGDFNGSGWTRGAFIAALLLPYGLRVSGQGFPIMSAHLGGDSITRLDGRVTIWHHVILFFFPREPFLCFNVNRKKICAPQNAELLEGSSLKSDGEAILLHRSLYRIKRWERKRKKVLNFPQIILNIKILCVLHKEGRSNTLSIPIALWEENG